MPDNGLLPPPDQPASLLAWFSSRARAIALIVAFAALLGWAQGTRRDIAASPQAASGGPPAYSDVQLYRDVAAALARGEPYYAAVNRLHRAHGFPTRPFVTVRLPTLAELIARTGEKLATMLLAGLLLLAAGLLATRLGRSRGEMLAIGAAILAGGAVVLAADMVNQHEVWAGVLLAIALALRSGPGWPLALLAAGAALAIREQALPFVTLAALAALIDRRPGQALAWVALALLFAIGLFVHARGVWAVARPDDFVSIGWSGMRGPGAALRDLVECSILVALPAGLAGTLVALPALGWLAAPRSEGAFALALAMGYLAILALFARDQTFYWALLLLPWWFAGFALVPRAVAQLARAIRG